MCQHIAMDRRWTGGKAQLLPCSHRTATLLGSKSAAPGVAETPASDQAAAATAPCSAMQPERRTRGVVTILIEHRSNTSSARHK